MTQTDWHPITLLYAMPCFMSQRSYKLYCVVLTKPNGIQQQRQIAKIYVLSPDLPRNLAQHSLLTQTKLAAEEKESFGPWGSSSSLQVTMSLLVLHKPSLVIFYFHHLQLMISLVMTNSLARTSSWTLQAEDSRIQIMVEYKREIISLRPVKFQQAKLILGKASIHQKKSCILKFKVCII